MSVEGGSRQVLVADSQPFYRQGLEAILAPTYEMVEVNCSRVLEPVDTCRVCSAIVGRFKDADQKIELIGKISQAGIPALAVIDKGDEYQISRAIVNGATGIIYRGASVDEMRQAVDQVVQGDSFSDSRFYSHILEIWETGIDPSPRVDLSLRETEIIRLISQGLTSEQIAQELGYSLRTISNSISRIYQFIDESTGRKSRGRAQIVNFGVKKGLVDVNSIKLSTGRLAS